jgi:hypothetical protein
VTSPVFFGASAIVPYTLATITVTKGAATTTYGGSPCDPAWTNYLFGYRVAVSGENILFGSRSPTTLNGVTINGIFGSNDQYDLRYITVELAGNRAKSFFFSLYPGDATIGTLLSSASSHTYNSGRVTTIWSWNVPATTTWYSTTSPATTVACAFQY